tara:strand:- start:2510 stop:2704 length:195 start_codon:yes stop_codon:yes gene_type:complete
MAKPSNTSLYNKVKTEAKSKFSVYPSAYASAWIVKTYKKRGGTYGGKKTSGIAKAAAKLRKQGV